MKNTMKKLLSLVLVAMLLVCAVPFQAAAATADITFKVLLNDDKTPTYEVSQAPANGASATIGAMLDNWYKDGYKEIKSAYIDYGNVKTSTVKGNVAETVIKAGETVSVRIVPADKPEEKPEEKPVEKPEQKFIRFQIKFDDSDDVTYTKIATPENGESAVIANLLTYWFGADWSKTYKFEHAYSSNKKETYTDINTTVYVDDTITVRLTTIKKDDGKKDDDTTTVRVTFYGTDGKAVSTYNVTSGSSIDSKKVSDAQSKTDNKTGYTFKGWKIDNKGDLYTSAQVANLVIKGNVDFYAYLEKDTTTTNNKFPYKVYLHIFKDNKVDDPAKTINITEGIALDGKVTLDEVKTVVKNYYTAKTSDGIKYDGMYLAEGNWVGNFVNDTKKYDTIEDTNEMRKTREVHINVMITNANAKSGSTEKADTTNPKTGDMIMIPVIFMLVSGAAIAGVYFYNKKRSAR